MSRFKVIIKILTCCLVIVSLWANAELDQSENTAISKLWGNTVSQYLQVPLWEPKNNYDAANALMIPLHFAFSSQGSIEQRAEFHHFFQRFLNSTPILFDKNSLRFWQFSYLISRYLTLSAYQKEWSESHTQLQRQLEASVEFFWFYRIRYDVTFKYRFAGYSERLKWKLSSQRSPAYASAVTDDEWFVMSVASDLSVIRALQGADLKSQPEWLQKTLSQSCQVLMKMSSFDEMGGWQAQPGIFQGHEDYLYAGNPQLGTSLSQAPVIGIGQDMGHAHRLPLWLISLQSAYEEDKECSDFLENVTTGLLAQIKKQVWVVSGDDFSAPRLKNFMDGSNGVYRYAYSTMGEQGGYGPWQLSGVLLTGWYPFLDASWVRDEYESLSKLFPLSNEVIELYTGPNTTRSRHELVQLPGYWTNGFAQLQALLAARLVPSEFLISGKARD